MDRIIVYVDDPRHAEQQLSPMKSGTRTPTHWLLVGCAPRMTQRVNQWLSRSARERWRTQWADRLFANLVPWLAAGGDTVTPMLATRPLPEFSARLVAEHGPARVLDARRPRFGLDLEPVTHDQPVATTARWSVPGAVAGLGAVLVLAAD